MRIIAGEHKGRRLKAPGWPGLRPTSDSLRETLFNLVQARVAGARVLDVFAGTGALGLEALSRGAAHAVFIEPDRRAAALIAANAALCGVQDRCAIIRDTAEHALDAPIAGAPFDLVMLDPPYEYVATDRAVAAAAARLADDGILVLEHAARRPPPALAGTPAFRTVRAGDSALTLYRRQDTP